MHTRTNSHNTQRTNQSLQPNHTHDHPCTPSTQPVLSDSACPTDCTTHNKHQHQDTDPHLHLHSAHNGFSLSDVTKHPLLFDVRPIPVEMTQSLASGPPCSPKDLPMNITGKSAHQLNVHLRKRLSHMLQSGIRLPAFSSITPSSILPRADCVEDMIAAYPDLHLLDYDNTPDCPLTTIDIDMWQDYHAKHCQHGCSGSSISDTCYFKPIHHMLRAGFQACLKPGQTLSPDALKSHTPAYVDLWVQQAKRCTTAFKKLRAGDTAFIIPVEGTPEFCFPLLPVIRSKDIWRANRLGTDFKVRLTSDSSTAGCNFLFADIKFRYWGVEDFAKFVKQGDYISSIDIKGYYTCLGAGELLRRLQYFQDPTSYASSTKANTLKVRRGDAKFLHQLTCMFGFKQLPWWASCVSAEIIRILNHEGCKVAGNIIDDFLLVHDGNKSIASANHEYNHAKKILRELGVTANDKGARPCHNLVFTGLQLDTIAMTMSISPEHRDYCIDRLHSYLHSSAIHMNDLRSLAGSLSWLCYVMPEGRPRRDALFDAMRDARSSRIKVTTRLRKQLRWWHAVLKSGAFSGSKVWSVLSQPPSILLRSDASGEHGFGVCVRNLHIHGCWRSALASYIEHNMLFKELLPYVIATVLLAPLRLQHIFAVGSDNAGMVFRVNAGSSRDQLVQRLLRLLARQITLFDITPIADWNERSFEDAVHADILSKTFTWDQWERMRPAEHRSRSWLIDIIIHDVASGQAVAAVFRIPSMD